MKISDIKTVIDIIQGIVIIGATIFTVKWTYKTFAHKEKIDELKELKKTIMLYHQKLQIFCAQVRKNETPDDNEIGEKLELAALHNKLVVLYTLSLYTKPEFRKDIQDIVGTWIANERIKIMQGRGNNSEERDKMWSKFEEERKKVFQLINEEVTRYI